jgi:predicted DNA-binding transcriptional regulator AlpA
MKEDKSVANDRIDIPTWTRKELEALLRVSGRTIDRLVAAGLFPAPLRVGNRCRWRSEDIYNYYLRGGPAGLPDNESLCK